MLFINEKKKEKLKEEIQKLENKKEEKKEQLNKEILGLKEKINELENSAELINAIIDEKNENIKRIEKNITNLKEEEKKLKKSITFMKDIKMKPNNVGKYVKISLNKLKKENKYFTSGEFYESYLYVYLEAENISGYPIISMSIDFRVEDLLGETLFCFYNSNSYHKLLPQQSCLIIDNSLFSSCAGYETGGCFDRPYDIDRILEQNDYLDKLVLKIESVDLVMLIDEEYKKISIDVD